MLGMVRSLVSSFLVSEWKQMETAITRWNIGTIGYVKCRF